MSNFRASTIRGVSWAVVDQIILQVINLLISAVLARLLTPQEFGLVSMVAILNGFVLILKDFGLGSAIVQKANIKAIELNNIFSFNIILGSFLCGVVYLSAPAIAKFYNEPALIPLTRVLSFSFILNSIVTVSDSLLIKSISFKKIFIKNLCASSMAGIVAIILASNGFSYWSLVGQSFTNLIVGMIGSFYFSKFSPSFQMDLKVIKPFWGFSMPLLGEQSMNYWVRNLDNLLVGKYLGSDQLGLYSKAYSLMLLPVRQISGTIMRVMFPSFALIQHDIPQVAKVYLKIIKVVAFISVPLMCSLAVAATPFISLLYGDQWLTIVPIFQALCFLGIVQSIATLSGSIFISQGKTALLFRIGVFCKVFMMGGIVVGLVSGGLMGLVVGYSMSSFVTFLIETYYLGNLIHISLFKILRSVFFEVLLGVIVGIVLYFTLHNYLVNMPPYIQVFCLGIEGVLIWIGLAQALKIESWLVIKNIAFGRV